jgi:hypothetical protein
MMRLLGWLLLPTTILALSAVIAACGDDDDGGSQEDRQEVADLTLQIATTSGATATQEQIDFYMAHITDAFVQPFGTESVDACRENAEECIGDPLENVTVGPDDVEIDGDSASVVLASEIGPIGINFVKEDGTWKAAAPFVPDDEIPEGTVVVDLELVDFGFNGDLDSDAVKSGDFAFHVKNSGEQAHEVILVELPAEGTLEELLNDESFEPEPILLKLPYSAGDESDVALPGKLAAGRYGLVCFFPDTEDPEGTPHAFKGMAAEFTVE